MNLIAIIDPSLFTVRAVQTGFRLGGGGVFPNHDCIYWLYLYGPHPLCPYLPIYFSTTHYTLHESCHFQAGVNAWAGVLLYIVRVKVQFSVCRLVKTVSRAGPQNVMLTTCFAEEATGPQWNNYWPVNKKMSAIRMRVNHKVPKFIF